MWPSEDWGEWAVEDRLESLLEGLCDAVRPSYAIEAGCYPGRSHAVLAKHAGSLACLEYNEARRSRGNRYLEAPDFSECDFFFLDGGERHELFRQWLIEAPAKAFLLLDDAKRYEWHELNQVPHLRFPTERGALLAQKGT